MISSLSLNQVLALYSWFPLAALLLMTLLIARFYQKFSGEATHFRLFWLPLILFGAGAVRYANVDGIVGDGLGDLALGAGGVSMLALCGVIYLRMLHKKPDIE